MNDFITLINARFALKDIGTLQYILRIKVSKLANGYLLHKQSKYIQSILEKAQLINAKVVVEPIISNFSLRTYVVNDYNNPTLRRNTLDAIEYVTITRFDIIFSVKKVFQYMIQSKDTHYGPMNRILRSLVNRILRYLNDAIDHGLEFKSSRAL